MIFVNLTRIYVIITLGDRMTRVNDISYVTRQGYAGDDIKRVEPTSESAKTKDSTHIPFYQTQINYDNESSDLNYNGIESIVNNDSRPRTNMDINTVKEVMDSGYNPVKEKLLEESENKSKVL